MSFLLRPLFFLIFAACTCIKSYEFLVYARSVCQVVQFLDLQRTNAFAELTFFCKQMIVAIWIVKR